MSDIDTFAESIGVTFADSAVLKTALTHRSYVNEHREAREHNERLEFLGDAVLELVTTDFLYKKYPHKPEGDLTAYRAALVNTTSIAGVAMTLGVNDYLLLSKGEAKDTGRARQYILANAFEAIIGAIYLDQGYAAAEQFIATNLLPHTDTIVAEGLWQDAKSRFQEIAQDKVSITPRYETLKAEGPDHDKIFTIGVFLDDTQVATGEGNSKQEAEQAAARSALQTKGW